MDEETKDVGSSDLSNTSTAKCHAAFAGKYSPDIENVRAVALPILRHRIVRNYKAEAEGITVEKLVEELI